MSSFEKKVEQFDKFAEWFLIIFISICLALCVFGSVVPEHKNIWFDFCHTIPGSLSIAFLCLAQGAKLHSSKPELHKHRVQISAVLLFIAFLLVTLYFSAVGFPGIFRGILLVFALEIVGWLLKEVICLLFNKVDENNGE